MVPSTFFLALFSVFTIEENKNRKLTAHIAQAIEPGGEKGGVSMEVIGEHNDLYRGTSREKLQTRRVSIKCGKQ